MNDNKLTKLKYLIDKGKELELDEITKLLNLTDFELKLLLRDLKNRYKTYDVVDGKVIKNASVVENKDIIKLDKDITKACFISDLHLGSIYDRPDVLEDIYHECEDREIDIIFCGGDVTDGYYPRIATIRENQKVTGYDTMKDYVLNTLPYNPYITMYTIAGNHDTTFNSYFNKDIVKDICDARKDLVYLGEDLADIITNNDIKIRLYHGYGKEIFDLEKRLNDYYHTIPNDSKPDIVQLGHIHRDYFTKIKNTYMIQCASLMNQNIYAQKNGFAEGISAGFAYFDKENNEFNLDYYLKEYEQSDNYKRVRRR